MTTRSCAATVNHTQTEAGSTAIELFGNDHVVSDVIIFGGQVGVHVTGGANLIEGVHTWNDATHAPSPGYGILISNTQSVRCLGVYLGELHACICVHSLAYSFTDSLTYVFTDSLTHAYIHRTHPEMVVCCCLVGRGD